MEDFKDRVCFVTGGARGIGRAVVEAFVGAGARVAFCDLVEPEGELAGTMFRRVDVRDAGALVGFMDEVCDAWGGIDIVVNNVGVGGFSPLTETSVEQFDEVLATNLRPVFITSRELARRRVRVKKYGRIINIASTRALQSEPGTEGYSASKGGVVALTHALAASLAGTGITVNCISPGWIDTGRFGELRSEDHAQHLSGRVGVPEDIARACLFLASPDNDFIDGANFVVDGGMTRRMVYVE
ncbi:MAG: SDR family oxidoreductase [Alistipes sp.]|jgi:NAD(P)-dependent dehydrogenase (short-subunit alcohol dehydrogenase family)|nr:SDR family oxidoreductase [Alistipes sp.]